MVTTFCLVSTALRLICNGEEVPTLVNQRLPEEAGLMRRHHFAVGSRGSLDGSATSGDANLEDLGGRLLREANDTLDHLKTNRLALGLRGRLTSKHRFKTNVSRRALKSGALLPTGQTLVTAHQKDSQSFAVSSSIAEFQPTAPQNFDGVWLQTNHKANTMNFTCSVYAVRAKCVSGEVSGFTGLDPRDCYGSCLSTLKGNGVTAGDSGYVALRYSIPSGCFCCVIPSALSSTRPIDSQYDTWNCNMRGPSAVVSPPPYTDGYYNSTTTTSIAPTMAPGTAGSAGDLLPDT